MSLPIAALAAVCLVAVWAGYSYSLLIDARAKVRESMSCVNAQLKLRHDLVPRLNDVVRSHADHEHEALRAAAAQRSQAIAARRIAEIEVAENSLAAELSHVLAVAKEYPQLRAAKTFLTLSDELRSIEDEIQVARARYNAEVKLYRSRADRLPTSLVAMWMKPKSFGYLKLELVDFSVTLTRVGEFAA